jgi:methyl-accepting chemotaxis protein
MTWVRDGSAAPGVRTKENMTQALKEKIGASMGLKLVVVITGVILVLMVLGTLFVARIMTADQYRHIETRGKDLGLFLGKAVTDPILQKDMIKLDSLVADAVKSRDMLYTYVTDASGGALSNVYVSFNKENPELREFLPKNVTDSTPALAFKVKARFDVLEVPVDIKIGGTKLGTVTMGFSKTSSRQNIREIVFLLLGTSVAIVLALVVMVYVMARKMIVIPTNEAVSVASNIAAGDLTQSVNIASRDELGMLGRGLNSMIVGLKGMIGSVQQTALNMESVSGEVKGASSQITIGSRAQAESVEEAASSVNEMHFALKEIAGTAQDLFATSEQTSSSVIETVASVDEVARTVSELSVSIEETSSAITQMSAAIRQIAENVEFLSGAAEETVASSSEISASVKEVEENAKQSLALSEAVAADAQQLGMRSIERTIEGMGRIDAAARRTADVVNRLVGRTESIGSILTVIEDVTDQTGLLALNAAILAAQAGEHGKGFSVVATEIRELANRTAASTQEISKLVASVQEESKVAVGVMQEGAAIVEEGVRLSTDAGEALRKILERAHQSRDMSKSINRAATEQARGIKQVSDSIDRISEMTHQIAKAANEQKAGSEQITRASERMRELTRFVKTSTEEQAKAGKDITAAVENMSAKIGLVNRATGEVQAGSDMIVKAIERIKQIAKENAKQAAGLDIAVEIMADQTRLLKREIEKFRT